MTGWLNATERERERERGREREREGEREGEREREGDIHLLQVPYSWKLFFVGLKFFLD